MSHEQSITLKINGKWRNIPSVVHGKKVNQPIAKAHAIKTKNIGKGYLTVKDAVDAAKKRSRSFNKK